MAMANPFTDLDLLMDHNTSFASSGSMAPSSPPPYPTPPPPPSSSALQLLDPESSSAVVLDSSSVSSSSFHASCHGFATLSLALGPAIAPAFLSSPNLIARPNPNPNSYRRPSNPPSSFPSQKKSINPSAALMPAISAAAISPQVITEGIRKSSTERSKSMKSNTAFPDYQKLLDLSGNFKEPNSSPAVRQSSIVWFRNDLRCHDNEALITASKESISLLPVYCFDPRDYGKSTSGFDKTGPYRAKFLLECVSVLRDNLRERGSELLVRVGKPEEVLVDLAKSIGADAVYANQEVSCEEVKCENKVSAALKEEGIDMKYFWGSTLFHIEDLPFKLENMPSTYSAFRESVQKLEVRGALESPKQLKGLPSLGGLKLGDIPTLQQLGLRPVSTPKQQQDGQPMVAAVSLVGGEAEALQRLKCFAQDHMKQSKGKPVASGGYGESQYGSNFSCKISPWLAMGCLSPRRMFEDLKSSSKSATSISASGESTTNDNGLNWLVFELLWRDFFRFITKKYAASKDGVVASPAAAALAV